MGLKEKLLQSKTGEKIIAVREEIRENEKNPEKMKLIEYISFALGGLCYGSIGHLVSGYRHQFYMSAGMQPDRVGLLVSAQTMFDSVNDPIIATYIDSRKDVSKGRFMPFLPRLVPVLAVFSVIMFSAPSFSNPTALVAWLFISYMLWETINTFSGISFDAIATVMSADQRERTLYTTIGNFGRQLSGAVPGFIPVALELLTRSQGARAPLMSETHFFTLCAVVFALIGGAAGIFTKNLKERISAPPKEGSVPRRVIENFRLFFQNKNLLLIWSTNIPQVIASAASPATLQFYIHSVGNAALQALQWTIAGIPQNLAHLLAPFFLKRFRPSRIIIFCTLANGVSFFILHFVGRVVGYDTFLGIVNIMIFASIGWIPSGIAGIASRMLQLNTFDYTAAKTGKRAEATSLMMFNMMSKWLWALAALIGGYALAYVGFVSAVDGVQQVQSQATRDGLFMIFSLFPAIGNLLGAIPMFFFKLEGKEYERRMAELNAVNVEKEAVISGIDQ